MEGVSIPLFVSGTGGVFVAPRLYTPSAGPSRLWFSSVCNVPYGPRRAQCLGNNNVPFILDEQYLSDPADAVLGCSFIPTDFLPWLSDVRPASDLNDIVGTLRFQIVPAADIFETQCRLTRNFTFQFDLVHFQRDLVTTFSSSRQLRWENDVLTLGGVPLPYIINQRCLKVVRINILPCIDASPLPRHMSSGPRPDRSMTHCLFRLDLSLTLATIPMAYKMFLHDVRASPSHRPAIWGHPVLRVGTLRLRFGSVPHVYSFECALLSCGWNDWTLSREALLNFQFPDGTPSPTFTSDALHIRGTLVPFLPPSQYVLAHVFTPAEMAFHLESSQQSRS